MSPRHREESLGLQPGYRIVWTGPPRMTIHEDGHRSIFIDTGFAAHSSENEFKGNVLTDRRNCTVKKVQVPTDHLEGLKEFFR